jgi:hypothetical protein
MMSKLVDMDDIGTGKRCWGLLVLNHSPFTLHYITLLLPVSVALSAAGGKVAEDEEDDDLLSLMDKAK